MLNRAYSVLDVKQFDPVKRTFSGIATSPVPDRMGDVIESEGLKFAPVLPLLLYHDHRRPVGEVRFGKPTKNGTPFSAVISSLDRDSGIVRERLDEAMDSLAANPPLIKGASIGFNPLVNPEFNKETGGFRFPSVEILELSMVVVPAHQDATIDVIKSLDVSHAALGADDTSLLAGVPASREPTRSWKVQSRIMQPTYAERIKDLEAQIETKRSDLFALQDKVTKDGRTKDATEREQFDTLQVEIKDLETELADAKVLEDMSATRATPVSGKTAEDAAAARTGPSSSFRIEPVKLPPGIGFARAVKARMVARMDGRNAVDVAKEMYPSDERLHKHIDHNLRIPQIIAQIKAAVPAATTTVSSWAGALVDPTNLAGEFIEFLRPATIIGKLNLRDVPFNVRMIEQTQGGNAYWVAQGAPKPLTAFGVSPVTLTPTKIAAIVVATEESIRFSTPSLDMLIRDGLRDAVVERADRDLLDPAEAGTTNVQPASLTNGLTALSSAGVSADNARTDMGGLIRALRTANLRGPIAIVMPDSLLTGLAWMANALGQPEFPGLSGDGGTFNGIKFIGSEYVANASGAGNMVVAIAEREVYLADDGSVAIDASNQASLQMLDNPTNNSASATPTTMVSMWQTNSVAFRAERFINWQKRRADAVAYIDDVNWGSVGSP